MRTLTLTLVLLTGCLASRQVTPWLRTWRHDPFCLLAEGSHACVSTVGVERRIDGAWVELPDLGDGAFAFAGGERAVVAGRLLSEHGPDRPLACDGDLRGAPDGSELVCVTVARDEPGRSATHVDIAHIDRDGGVRARRQVALPVVLARRPIEGPHVSTSWLGFDPHGLVFTVFVSRAEESFANGAPKLATAFRLGPSDRWQRLGVLDFRCPEFWKLHFPRPWNERHGWQIERGRYEQDSRLEPSP